MAACQPVFGSAVGGVSSAGRRIHLRAVQSFNSQHPRMPLDTSSAQCVEGTEQTIIHRRLDALSRDASIYRRGRTSRRQGRIRFPLFIDCSEEEEEECKTIPKHARL